MKIIYALLFIVFLIPLNAQQLNGQELLEKSISYHDPNNNWPSFKDSFQVTMTTPNQSPRVSDITINLPAENFSLTAVRDSITQGYTLNKNTCILHYNNKELSKEEAKSKNMPCERATLYKNYYTYLYGLPMKLKDDGTNIDPKVGYKKFKGKDYLVLKATYDKDVGSDVWYFYFNPTTYAMETYQFFKTDENGALMEDTGEYILLTEEENVNGIKMPKVRKWYYNKDDGYLGTDVLSSKN
jgi:hypothetical protein